MFRSTRFVPTLLTTFAVLIAACDTSEEPLSPPAPQRAELPQVARDQNPDQSALGRTIPAFGGLFLDENGVPTVFLTDPSARGAVASALAGFLTERGVAAAQLSVLQARFSYNQLEGFFDRLRPDAFAGPGTVFVDLDEARNQVVMGVENAVAASRVSALVAALGLPDGAVAVEHAEPVYALATLRERFGQVPAGVQIHFGGYLCSIGIIATVGGQPHFVTASHCTERQGGVEGTLYYQPTSGVDGTAIGTEVADPDYYDFKAGCEYVGVKCRYSDAALIRSSGARTFLLGSIAQTALNSTTWTGGYFNVTGKASGNGIKGDARGKVGRTTGYTTGKVSRTCVDTGVQGSNKALLCQDWVDGSGEIVGAGDSGSGVFAGTSNVTWWGILWGGTGDGGTFIYSPASNVELELGALTVSGSGGGGGGGGGTPELTAAFTYNCRFNDCTFDASSSTGATSYNWNFGDGGTASGVTASRVYTDDGSYVVTLTVGDGSASDTSTRTVSCVTRGKNRQCR